MTQRQKPVENLLNLLQSNDYLKDAVETSLRKAAEPGIETLEAFYDFLERILTHIPTEKELMPSVRQFYFVLSMSPDDILTKDKNFNEWIQEFIVSRGDFLDTVESTGNLDTFIRNPEYHIDDYITGPSGWLTYNQFLARQLKPGKRPVAGLCDDRIIVAPADSEYKGSWPINDNSTLVVKGIEYSVTQLLNGSSYQDKFTNGIFTHSFLDITDYHRYHVPVSGIVREVKIIPAGTWVHEAKKPGGSLENIDDVGFQFTHTRGYIIMESPAGFVAVMPVGMGHISSVNLTGEEGTALVKGTEFGYFAFGGSDMIMLFEPNRVKLTAKENMHYKQGQEIGRVITGNSFLSDQGSQTE